MYRSYIVTISNVIVSYFNINPLQSNCIASALLFAQKAHPYVRPSSSCQQTVGPVIR